MSQSTDDSDSGSGAKETTSAMAIGDLIAGRYEVLAHIGSGGMGEVYKVRDQETQTIYALKMISPHLAQQQLLAKRLEHEAQAARTLAHGNIVSVYDVGKAFNGAPFLLMDYVEGESLDALLKKEAFLSQSRALPIFVQIADALVHARQKGIVHRDLKPSNILMTKTEAGVDIVKIVDFGIAKITGQEHEDKAKLTQTGELLGTPLYMSPEQCRGDDIDARADIYSFGCIMYEILTGHPPFTAENSVRVILKHLNEEPAAFEPSLGISTDLRNVIFRCLSKSPEDRYANAVDLHIDLERIVEGRPIAQYKQKRKKAGEKNRVIAACAFLTIVAGITVFTFQNHKSNPTAGQPAEQNRPDTYRDKTLDDWTAEIEKNPKPELYFGRGVLHGMRDERTNAVDDYSQAIAMKPDYIEAIRNRAQMYADMAKLNLARADADLAIKLDPTSANSFQTRGWVDSASENYEQAIADWKKAYALDSSSYDLYNIAWSLLKLAKYKEARAAIHQAIGMDRQENRSVPWYWASAGLIDAFTQNYDSAKSEFLKGTETDEARGVEWQFLAYYYVCVGDMTSAEQAIKRAKQIETFPARAFRLEGELYRTAGKYDQAIKAFSASTSLEDYAPGFRQKAMVYVTLGQWRSAYQDLKKSFDLNPYSVTTMSYLALAEDHLGMKKEAALHMEQAFKPKMLPPIVVTNRALMELNDGHLKDALDDANKALSLDPFLKEAYQARADVSLKMNNTAGAQADKARADKLVSHLDY